MPIYEYCCCKCQHQFEEIILSKEEGSPSCPKCKSEKVERLISTGNIRPKGIPKGSGGFKAPACAPSG